MKFEDFRPTNAINVAPIATNILSENSKSTKLIPREFEIAIETEFPSANPTLNANIVERKSRILKSNIEIKKEIRRELNRLWETGKK